MKLLKYAFFTLLKFCVIIMEWVIVRFFNEDEVEAIPLKWITEDKKYYYFPSLKENVKKAIKYCFDINPAWQKYECAQQKNISYISIYIKFATATAKTSKACLVPDLSECDTATLSKKRK